MIACPQSCMIAISCVIRVILPITDPIITSNMKELIQALMLLIMILWIFITAVFVIEGIRERERLQDTKDFIHSLSTAPSCTIKPPLCSL